jgi:hypothetical protein
MLCAGILIRKTGSKKCRQQVFFLLAFEGKNFVFVFVWGDVFYGLVEDSPQ